ncbi:serine hydrolase [Halomonas sp. PA5]|nr:serine hydrolase [Halomonas sp. PA5]
MLMLALTWLPPVTVVAATPGQAAPASLYEEAPVTWKSTLETRLAELEAGFPGEFGVYVQDLNTDESYSWRGDEWWYLASLIKVPVAIEVFARIERGELALDDSLVLRQSDYVDGAGQTNWQAPGTPLLVEFLLEQMLTVSDNTASDMLIHHVGLEAINRRARSLISSSEEQAHERLGEITTLVDVRRHLYGAMHPRAFELSGRDFIALRQAGNMAQRIEAFRIRLGVSRDALQMADMDQAFDAYEATGLNGGQLSAFGEMLASLSKGRALSPASTAELLSIMRRTRSGERRLKLGLPGELSFAHKTGTQHRRICDAGILTQDIAPMGLSPPALQEPPPRVVIVTCTRGPLSGGRAEQALAEIGAAVRSSGVTGRP